MILSDGSIRELVEKVDLILPYNEKQLQPASYDVTLEDIHHFTEENFQGTDYWILSAGEFVLGSTLEKICLPDNIVARIEGKSSWARKGLIVHTAGFIDPGFCGTLTLEITNLNRKSIVLEKGKLIAQIAFQFMDKPAEKPYGHPLLGSKYQHQQGVTQSKI